jgi:GNAT superfamily N-acetyltransferase
MELDIQTADLDEPADAAAIVTVLDTYAGDEWGGGQALPPDVREQLVPGLRRHGRTLVLLAREAGEAIGVAICFWGFSTFKARPLLNVHDLAVVPGRRGRGAGAALLAAAEAEARDAGCCKLTLEVQDTNLRARGLYERVGFRQFTLNGANATLFLEKPLA